MNAPTLSVRDRIHAWLVTGPVGRVAAFFADLATYAWRSASRRARRPGER